MSFSASEGPEGEAPKPDAAAEQLIAALADEELWVRLGAAQALAAAWPDAARAPLRARCERAPYGSEEQWAVILALETCGEDMSPLIAQLAGAGSAAALSRAMGLDSDDPAGAHDAWVWFVRRRQDLLPFAARNILGEIRILRRNRHLAAGAPARPGALSLGPLNLLARLLDFGRGRQRSAADGAADGPEESRQEAVAQVIESRLSFAVSYLQDRRFEADSKERFAPVLSSLRSEGPDQIQQGLRDLVEIATCDPNGWFRDAARRALARSGPEGGDLLLPGLRGQPLFAPTAEQLRALALQADEPPRHGVSAEDGPAAATFFTVEALARFRDPETLNAILVVALRGSAEAERVLAAMPLEVSLPLLVWTAVNALEGRDRDRASEIMGRIVRKDRDYSIHLHRIGDTVVDADLDWITRLVARGRRVSTWAAAQEQAGPLSWIRNRDAAGLLLPAMLRLVPLMNGEVHILYKDASPWDRFVAHLRRVTSLRARENESPDAGDGRRYLHCEFPERCLLHHPETLTLALDLAPPGGEAAATPVTVGFAHGETEASVVVLVQSSGFLVEPGYQVLRVPLHGSSPRVEFRLTPREPGTQTIEITLLRDAERVGYTCLAVAVAPEGASSGQARPQPADETTNHDLVRLGITRALVLVEWTGDGHLSYRLVDPASGSSEPRETGTSRTALLEPQVREWAERQSEIIQDYLREDYATQAELNDALAGLRSIGHTLFEQLVPPQLAAQAAAWPPGSLVAIDSNEGWVPWELLCDSPSGQLWGERFQVIRTPRLPLRHPAGAAVSAAAIQTGVEVKKIVSVVGDQIGMGNQPGMYSARQTFGKAEPLVRELVQAGFGDFQHEASDADVIHFTCHARGKPAYHLSLGPGASRRLLVGQVESLKLRPGVIVFANACASDKPEVFLTELQSFGWRFYSRGARPFIGTLGPVPSRHAIRFAQHFYRWFILEGQPAGLALREARREVAREFRNPFYLFYCLYGSASVGRYLGAGPR